MSREKRPGYEHHKKAGAMNALVESPFLTIKLKAFLVFFCLSISLLTFFLLLCWLIVKVRVSAIITNAPYLLNVDCDHYINNSKALRESMCFMMDPTSGKKICYVQFPQRFDGIDRNDRYSNRNVVFFDVSKNLLVLFEHIYYHTIHTYSF